MQPLNRYPLIFSLTMLFFAGCVSTGQFKAVQQQAQQSDSLYTWAMHTLKTCQADNDNLNKQKVSLQGQMNSQSTLLTASNENNIQLRKQLQDLSAITNAQAASIRSSLDNMGSNDKYLQDLHKALYHRDSVNLAILANLKMTLGGFGDQDVHIKLEEGVVSVDLSDSLLFNSDSNGYVLSDKAKSILGRFARALADQSDLEFTVEGHADSVVNVLSDNWELSARRATAVVRMLQNDYNMVPGRMTAAGSSTPDRSTRIVITPQLAPLMRVLDGKQGVNAAAVPAKDTTILLKN